MRLPSAAGSGPTRLQNASSIVPNVLPEVLVVRREPEKQAVIRVADRGVAIGERVLGSVGAPGRQGGQVEVARLHHVGRLASLESGARDVVPVAGQGGLRRRARPSRLGEGWCRPLRYAHVDDPVGTHVPQDDLRAPREGDDEPRHRRLPAEAEVDARILRRQVAAPRLHLARRAARSHDRARHEARESHVEPVADRAGRPQQQQLPADRVHGDRHPAVVADVGGGDAAPVADEARRRRGRPTRRPVTCRTWCARARARPRRRGRGSSPGSPRRPARAAGCRSSRGRPTWRPSRRSRCRAPGRTSGARSRSGAGADWR